MQGPFCIAVVFQVEVILSGTSNSCNAFRSVDAFQLANEGRQGLEEVALRKIRKSERA